MSVNVVVTKMLHALKEGPEQKHPEMLSRLVSTMQANISAALTEVYSALRKLWSLLLWLRRNSCLRQVSALVNVQCWGWKSGQMHLPGVMT